MAKFEVILRDIPNPNYMNWSMYWECDTFAQAEAKTLDLLAPGNTSKIIRIVKDY